MADAGVLSPTLDPAPVLRALRRLDGRATVADITAATGLERAQAEETLRRLLEDRRGHLEVGERGDLVYRFEKGLLSREATSLWTRVKKGAWAAFKVGFKVWIVGMLVLYTIVFVALLIAALFANRDGDGGGLGGGREGGGSRGGGMRLPMGDFWLWYWLWGPRWRGRPYYGEGYGERRRGVRGRKDGPPFYKKVFAFVFGPDEPVRSKEAKDRDLLRFVRSRQGVVSATDLVQHSGMELHEADEELARLMAVHEGDVKVTDDGTLLYVFPDLMVSAHGTVRERDPAPAWRRLEPSRPLTGNTAGTNALIVAMNGFNLVAAATAPWFIFPRLGISGLAAEIALIWVPVAFSSVFFAVPGLRWLGVTRENARRAARNVRKAVLGLVSKFTLSGKEPEALPLPEAETHVAAVSKGKVPLAKDAVLPTLDRLVAEFDGEVEADEAGTPSFRFPLFRRQMEVAHRERGALALQGRTVGDIVYASDDDDATAGRRELEAFDRELEALGSGGADSVEAGLSSADAGRRALPPADDLSAYLNDPD
ncbi:MAG: hypothetical protein HKO98_07190, partial [Gemmatimonadetes bacterium]|nr:hypothetical protein [Gemmatimonadota bacterium]